MYDKELVSELARDYRPRPNADWLSRIPERQRRRLLSGFEQVVIGPVRLYTKDALLAIMEQAATLSG